MAEVAAQWLTPKYARVSRVADPVRGINIKLPPAGGTGYLADAFPDGITTVDNVPASATVRILYRPAGGSFDGRVVATTQSGDDGTWRVDGLNPAYKYDIVVRKEGCNDVIQSNVMPSIETP